jgi:hypothetical protein
MRDVIQDLSVYWWSERLSTAEGIDKYMYSAIPYRHCDMCILLKKHYRCIDVLNKTTAYIIEENLYSTYILAQTPNATTLVFGQYYIYSEFVTLVILPTHTTNTSR